MVWATGNPAIEGANEFQPSETRSWPIRIDLLDVVCSKTPPFHRLCVKDAVDNSLVINCVSDKLKNGWSAAGKKTRLEHRFCLKMSTDDLNEDALNSFAFEP